MCCQEKWDMKLIFCMQINTKVSYKLTSTLWASQFPARWYYYYWWTEPSILKSSKFTISLQYLKKEVKNGVYFLHVDKHQNFCKLALSSLTEVARHVQGTQNRKLVIFFQCIEKKVSQLLLCSIVMQTVQNFTEVQSFSLLLVFGWWSKIDAVF